METASASRTRRTALTFWVSPEDQPRWSRPLLLVVTLVAAVLYAWRAGPYLEGYYAAAVRSMSSSWHDFFFGSFDPAGTVTLDKLPGAFWVQAVSVRVFGLHTWSIVLPQVVEGVLSVLVVFRIVRRLAGAAAGLLAATVLTLAPATVALNRGNISDTLMILLVLLAADAAVSVVVKGRWSSVLLAGFWVGLAFQAKMIEAWLVLPALWLITLVAGAGGWRRRLGQVVIMGLAALVISLSWMTVVTLTPAASRPYVDGSPDNSLFHQVFVYNGFGRVDQSSPNQLLSQSIGLAIPAPPPPTWHRLLTGSLGRNGGWLLPAAAVSLVTGLVATRRRPRYDLERVNFLLWGTWLVVLAGSFSFSSSINSYYVAALSPAIGGLLAGGFMVAWRGRDSIIVRLVTATTVLVTAGYAAWLLPDTGTGLPGWLEPVLVVIGIAAIVVLLDPFGSKSRPRLVVAGLGVSLVAVLVVPTVASASMVTNRLGSFDTPFQPAAVTSGIRLFFGVSSTTAALLPTLERARNGAPYLMATQTAALAAPFIFNSGEEVLPIGGFTGTIPAPTLSAIQTMVRQGRFHLVLQSPKASDPRLVWIARHCISLPQPTSVPGGVSTLFAIHYCVPGSTAGGSDIGSK